MLTIMKLTVVCVFASFAVQVLGFLCPLWLNIEIYAPNGSYTNISGILTENYFSENNNESFYSFNESLVSISRSYGLWYVFTCVNANCSFGEYPGWYDVTSEINDEIDRGYNFTWIDSRVPVSTHKLFLVEVMLGLSILFVALLQVCHHKSLYQSHHSGAITQHCHSLRNCASIVCLAISGVLMTHPFISYAKVNADFKTFLIRIQTEDILNDTGYSQISVGVPYSVYFSGSGFALALFAGIFLFLQMTLRGKRNISRQNNGIPLSIRHNENSTYESAGIASNVVERVVGNPHGHHVLLDAERAREQTFGSLPYANVAGIQYCDGAGKDEDPPPSYEEAMRLYAKTDG